MQDSQGEQRSKVIVYNSQLSTQSEHQDSHKGSLCLLEWEAKVLTNGLDPARRLATNGSAPFVSSTHTVYKTTCTRAKVN
jgi:hypothetical protein